MDIVIAFFICIFVAMFVFSRVAGVLYAILWIVELFMIGSDLIFVLAMIFLIGTKRRVTEFGGFGEFHDIPYALYLYEGEVYKNIFPTDNIFTKLLYRKKNPKVFLGKRFGLSYALDTLTIVICAIGLPFFTLMTAAFGGYIILIW